VVIVKLEVGVAAIGQVREESAGEVGDLRPDVLIQLRADVGERAIQLVVRAAIQRERAHALLRLFQIVTSALRRRPGIACRFQLLLRGEPRELGAPMLLDGRLVAGLELLECRLRESRFLLTQAEIVEALADAAQLLPYALQLLTDLRLAIRERAQTDGFFGERGQLREL